MANNESGFSTYTLIMVVAAIGIIVAMAFPQAVNSLNNYLVHCDASEIAGYLKAKRVRTAPQGALAPVQASPHRKRNSRRSYRGDATSRNSESGQVQRKK